MTERFGIPAGNYDSIDMIVTTLNKMQKQLIFMYNPITKHCSILPYETPPGKDILITIGPNETLLNLLGFKYDPSETAIKFDGDQINSPHEANITLHFPTIFVYSDVVKHQLVNGMMAQMLFDDAITGEKGTYVDRRIGPKEAMYLTVGKKYISQLTFEICDDTGQLIPFQAGKVQIRLYFRPKHI